MKFNVKGSFLIYLDSDKRKMFPTTWIYSSKYSNDNRLVFQSYDANLYPLPDIWLWNPNTIHENCEKISELFKDCDKEIYLDGYLLDKATKTLSKIQIDN